MEKGKKWLNAYFDKMYIPKNVVHMETEVEYEV